MIKTEEIKALLEKDPEVSAYEIKAVENEGKQLYYVLGKLETSRAVSSEDIRVSVYHDFETFRGSSNFNVTANDDAESIAAKIRDCVAKAKQVKNPYYPLAENQKSVQDKKELKEKVSASLKNVADALFAANHFANTDMNATEIFADVDHVRFLNSNGVFHSYDKLSLFIESIPSYNAEEDEYELYFSTRKGSFSCEGLTEEMEEELKNVRYRAEAKTLKEVDLPANIPVVVKSSMIGYLMGYFASQLSYQSTYYQSNHFKVGDVVSQKPFSLTLKGEEEGALASSPIDENGLHLGQTKVIDKGVAAARWGDLRFGTYLKEEQITGNYHVIVMDEYEPISEEEFAQPHITIMNFSAPQLDDSSGYFGGEVRLALYENKGEIIPLTGFSISGNIFEAIHTAEFSEECEVSNGRISFKGPKYLILKNMSIH